MVASQAAQAVAPVVQLQQQLQRALLWIRPDGWQGRARRNAWAAMVDGSQRRHDRPMVDRESHSATSVASARSTAAAVSAAAASARSAAAAVSARSAAAAASARSAAVAVNARGAAAAASARSAAAINAREFAAAH
jgi:hypothetical protein